MEKLKYIFHSTNLFLGMFLISGVLSQQVTDKQKQTSRSYPMVNSDPVNDREFAPYMVALYEMVPFAFKCGGTIISEAYILTAAHCVTLNNTYKINVGSLYTYSGTGQDYDISDVIIHPDFESSPEVINDIALLKVGTPITFNNYSQPLSLAENNFPDNGLLALLLGFGLIQVPSNELGMLRFGYIQVLSEAECQLDEPRPPSRTLCTYVDENQMAPCHGDSGGPLVYENVLIGIVSSGPDVCATMGSAVLYTKVSAFREWIWNVSGV